MDVAVSSDLSFGSVFAGRYRVERRIAAGGMGAVHEVVHIETNRRCALKVMLAHYIHSDELRTRFRQEARVAAEIESEHIVDVLDAGVDEATGMPFLVMELLRGEDLAKLVKREGPLSPYDVVRYLYETSLALDKTHRARIVHRDLKPDNLFLCERDHGPPRVKVLDFGIAKIIKDASTQAQATRPLGTPLYMAPEQFHLQSAITPATDIYALGMIAFTLLVGKPYWDRESKGGADMFAFAIHVAKGTTESPVFRAWERHGIQLPNAFEDWFFQATAREPEARFKTAGEAVLRLADALGVPSPADSTAVAPRASTPVQSGQERSSASVHSTIVMPLAGKSSPPVEQHAGPTLMGMTPVPVNHAPSTDKPYLRSGSLVFMSVLATVMVGLGAAEVVKRFGTGRGSPIEEPEQAARMKSVASPIANLQPVAELFSSEPPMRVLPTPSSSDQTKVTPQPTATIHNRPTLKVPSEKNKPAISQSAAPKPEVKKQSIDNDEWTR